MLCLANNLTPNGAKISHSEASHTYSTRLASDGAISASVQVVTPWTCVSFSRPIFKGDHNYDEDDDHRWDDDDDGDDDDDDDVI